MFTEINQLNKPVLSQLGPKASGIDQLKHGLTAKADAGDAKAQLALGRLYQYGTLGPDREARSPTMRELPTGFMRRRTTAKLRLRMTWRFSTVTGWGSRQAQPNPSSSSKKPQKPNSCPRCRCYPRPMPGKGTR